MNQVGIPAWRERSLKTMPTSRLFPGRAGLLPALAGFRWAGQSETFHDQGDVGAAVGVADEVGEVEALHHVQQPVAHVQVV